MAEPMEVEATKQKSENPKPTKTQIKQTSLPWVEKYRPTNLSDLISQEDLIETLSRFIEQNKLPHLLFYGPPGTGKTSTILSVARKILGPSFRSMILELNASDVRGIDDVRETIKDFASTKKIFSQGVKIVVLDEADHMTNDAQAALRRIIERYTKSTRFCLICNHINRITPAIQSRCMRFRFAPLKDDQVRLRLSEIAKQESVKITADGLEALIKLGTGDMRRSINILQSTSMAYDIVNEMNVYLCTGNPLPSDIRLILDWMCNKELEEAYALIIKLKNQKGLALADIVKKVHAFVGKLELRPESVVELYSALADVEYRLASGGSEKIQLGALVGAFQVFKDQVVGDD